MSHTVFKLSHSIGQISAFDIGVVPLINALFSVISANVKSYIVRN